MNQPRTARDRLDRALSIVARARRFVVPAVALLMLGAIASVAFAMVRQRTFKSEALILYREAARASDSDGAAATGDRSHKLGLRVKDMVLSRSRLEQIIRDANLYPALVDERGLVEAADEMRTHISFRVQDSNTFGVSFEGENPTRVQEVTSKLADALIAENARPVPEAAGQARELLDADKARIEADLKLKETALAQFVTKHPEFANSAPGSSPAAAAARAPAVKPASIPKGGDPALASLEREAQRLQERLGMPVGRSKREEAQADPALVAAKQAAENEARDAQKELSEKQSEFTEEHPDVRAAMARNKLAQEKLKRTSDALTASLNAARQKDAAKEEDEGYIDRGALENQLKRINEEIVEYKRRRSHANEAPTQVATSVVAVEADWTRLHRDVADAREQLQLVQEKIRASTAERAAAAGNTAQMLVIDPAFLPHAAKPGRTMIAAAGIALSLVMALALALMLALLDDRLYDRVDVERFGLLPLLGVVPGVDDKKVKRG
ncbi:MAG: hypothetical protein JWN44_2563 [Myxococcales bacterium]|nr:hypothetical protein [Myxococcales bacterium]